MLLDHAGPLVRTYELANAWEPLSDLYARLLIAFETLFNAQATAAARRNVLRRYPRLARWAAFAFAKSGRLPASVEALERARTRELDVSARHDTADVEAVRQQDPELALAYTQALATFRSAGSSHNPGLAPTAPHEAVNAAADLTRVILLIRELPGMERFLLPPTAPESLADCGARQAIYIVPAPQGSFVLGLRPGMRSHSPTYSAIEVAVSSGDVVQALLGDSDGSPGLLAAQMPDSDGHSFAPSLARAQQLLMPITSAVAQLAADTSPAPSVLVATGLLGMLPLHALSIEPPGHTLDDLVEIHNAPSLAVYAASYRRSHRRLSKIFVGIADADADAPLPGTRGEIATIAKRPNWSSVAVATGEEATLPWLMSQAPVASHLHLACHGSNTLDDDEGSKLWLAGGEPLTVPTLVHRIRLQARVAVASACQSAQFDASRAPDEHVGLTSGLLQAGAACAIVSLWPVDDEATALLMSRFYELLDSDSAKEPHEERPQAALRSARLWLRDLTEHDRARYLDEHTELASVLAARGLPQATTRGTARGPYEAVEEWGAFIAHGC